MIHSFIKRIQIVLSSSPQKVIVTNLKMNYIE